MIQIRSLFCLMFILIPGILFSQVEENINNNSDNKKRFTDRLVFGGDFGLNFGTITYIKIAPVIGYRVTDRFVAGLGPIYIYEKYRNYDLKTSTFGGKLIASYTLIKTSNISGSLGFGDIVLHAENELINIQPLFFNPNSLYYYLGDRLWIDNLLVGGGLSQTIGGSVGVSIFVLWDVTGNKYSPYSNPVLKFGFYF